LLQPHVDNGLVVLKTSTEAKDLLTNERGDVIGVSTLDADGKAEKFMGKNVVLTSGGYASNAQMFEELEGAIDYSDVSYPYSQGAGIKLGQSVGGYVRYGENHLPLWGAILADDDFPSPMAAVARHFPGDRPPWEIIINAEGKRILKEDVLSHAVYEEVLVEQPGEQCWAVWDQKINDEAPRYIMTGFGTMAAEDVPDAFNEGWTNFYKADTLDELATKMGISVSGLAETVEKYNRSVETGVDEDFGRTHMPLPIEQGPFYGIHMRSWFLTTTAGLAVNKDLQLITQEGKPIGNLYAAGEILGTGATSGRAICGGMLVTPAIAFGKLLGERILQFDI
jgi:fumarate reductase flavoprotein subunit